MRIFSKTKSCIAVLSLGVVLFAPTAMAFGLGDLTGSKPAAGATAGDPDAFIKSAQEADALMNNSVGSLFKALTSKNDQAQVEEQQKAANAATDPKAKAVLVEKIQESQLAGIAAANANKSFDSDIGKLDATKKANLGASAFNFMLALLKDKDLIGQAQGLISSLSSNPMNIGKLGAIKDASGNLSSQMTAASNVAGMMPKIFKAVKVEAPTKADEKPKTFAATTTE